MRLILFDCDGTLVDSQHMIVEAMGTAFTASGLAMPERAHILRHVGLSVAEAMESMTGSQDAQVIAVLCRDYRAAFAELRQSARIEAPLFPGAREALTQLHARDDLLLGIATGKSKRGVQALLKQEGLDGLFATIQTADDAPSKPHPAMVHQAMEETGAKPADTLVIGDTSFDMLMARAASASAIGVSWGYHDADALMDAGALKVVDDFAALIECLRPGTRVVAA